MSDFSNCFRISFGTAGLDDLYDQIMAFPGFQEMLDESDNHQRYPTKETYESFINSPDNRHELPLHTMKYKYENNTSPSVSKRLQTVYSLLDRNSK